MEDFSIISIPIGYDRKYIFDHNRLTKRKFIAVPIAVTAIFKLSDCLKTKLKTMIEHWV